MYQLFFVGFLSSTIFQQHPSADRHTSVTSDTWTTPLRTCPCRPAPTSPTNTSQHRMHQRHPLRYRTFLLGIHVVGLEGFFFCGNLDWKPFVDGRGKLEAFAQTSGRGYHYCDHCCNFACGKYVFFSTLRLLAVAGSLRARGMKTKQW